MKYTRKDLSPNQIELIIRLDGQKLKPAHHAAVAKLAKDIKVAGFRTGHVPAKVAEKQIDQNKLFEAVINDVASAALTEVIETEQIQMLDKPAINITKFVPQQELELTAIIPIVPPVKLGDVKQLKVKRQSTNITEADIDEVVDRLATGAATKTPVKRLARLGDEVILDFDGRDSKNQPIAGAKAENYTLILGSNSFIVGFEDGLVGQKAGDKFDLRLTFPKDYQAKALAGKPVTFKINLRQVNQLTKPDLDDKFAATIGSFKTMAELRQDIKKELTARGDFDLDQRYKNDLLEALTKKSSVEVPDVLIDDQLTSLEQQFVQNLAYGGLTLEQYLEKEKLSHHQWVEKELRPAAEKRVKASLVLRELSRRQQISASDQEIDHRLKELTAKCNDPNLRSQFQTKAARRDVANQIVSQKTLDWLASQNS
jgi:trigger factor